MTEWFYRLNGTNQGPVSEADLKHIFDSGALPLTTSVWHEGMEEWVEAQKMPNMTGSSFEAILLKAPTQDRPKHLPAIQAEMKRSIPKPVAVFCICLIAIGVCVFIKRLSNKSLNRKSDVAADVQPESKNELTDSGTKTEEQGTTDAQAAKEREMQAAGQSDGLGDLGQTYQFKDARESDEETLESYIKAVNLNDSDTLFRIFKRVSSAVLSPIDTHLIADPVKGDPQKVHEIMQYVSDKIRVNDGNYNFTNSFEIGCLGKSDLWEYRETTGITYHPIISCVIFLLRDIDPSSATIITQTDRNTGQQKFFLKLKCTNKLKRVVGMRHTYTIDTLYASEVSLPCADEADAKRIGKALAALVYAYGGKFELIDSSDSY